MSGRTSPQSASEWMDTPVLCHTVSGHTSAQPASEWVGTPVLCHTVGGHTSAQPASGWADAQVLKTIRASLLRNVTPWPFSALCPGSPKPWCCGQALMFSELCGTSSNGEWSGKPHSLRDAEKSAAVWGHMWQIQSCYEMTLKTGQREGKLLLPRLETGQ